ncbi:hypothetical protein HK101_007693 [Irineochytrium annulatum]|nr:hypothetical protein HK101_007693 [Irineochytrium annulatum]
MANTRMPRPPAADAGLDAVAAAGGGRVPVHPALLTHLRNSLREVALDLEDTFTLLKDTSLTALRVQRSPRSADDLSDVLQFTHTGICHTMDLSTLAATLLSFSPFPSPTLYSSHDRHRQQISNIRKTFAELEDTLSRHITVLVVSGQIGEHESDVVASLCGDLESLSANLCDALITALDAWVTAASLPEQPGTSHTHTTHNLAQLSSHAIGAFNSIARMDFARQRANPAPLLASTSDMLLSCDRFFARVVDDETERKEKRLERDMRRQSSVSSGSTLCGDDVGDESAAGAGGNASCTRRRRAPSSPPGVVYAAARTDAVAAAIMVLARSLAEPVRGEMDEGEEEDGAGYDDEEDETLGRDATLRAARATFMRSLEVLVTLVEDALKRSADESSALSRSPSPPIPSSPVQRPLSVIADDGTSSMVANVGGAGVVRAPSKRGLRRTTRTLPPSPSGAGPSGSSPRMEPSSLRRAEVVEGGRVSPGSQMTGDRLAVPTRGASLHIAIMPADLLPYLEADTIESWRVASLDRTGGSSLGSASSPTSPRTLASTTSLSEIELKDAMTPLTANADEIITPTPKYIPLANLVRIVTDWRIFDPAFQTLFINTYTTFTTLPDLLLHFLNRLNPTPPPNLPPALIPLHNTTVPPLARLATLRLLADLLAANPDPANPTSTIRGDVLTLLDVVGDVTGELAGAGDALRAVLDQAEMDATARPLTPPASRALGAADLLHADPRRVAEQMALLDAEIYSRLRPADLLDRAGASFRRRSTDCRDPVAQLTDRFNLVVGMVTTLVMSSPTARARAAVVAHFVRVAELSVDLGSLNAANAITSALHSASLHRLAQTWRHVDSEQQECLARLQALFSPAKNFSALRGHLAGVSEQGGKCVPWLGMHLRDLVAIVECGNGATSCPGGAGAVDLRRVRALGRGVEEVLKFQGECYAFAVDEALRAVLIERRGLLRSPSMQFEESLRVEPRARSGVDGAHGRWKWTLGGRMRN